MREWLSGNATIDMTAPGAGLGSSGVAACILVAPSETVVRFETETKCDIPLRELESSHLRNLFARLHFQDEAQSKFAKEDLKTTCTKKQRLYQ
jgi:hypothetical protein